MLRALAHAPGARPRGQASVTKTEYLVTYARHNSFVLAVFTSLSAARDFAREWQKTGARKPIVAKVLR